jgi:hypothetical protein
VLRSTVKKLTKIRNYLEIIFDGSIGTQTGQISLSLSTIPSVFFLIANNNIGFNKRFFRNVLFLVPPTLFG